MEIKRRGTKQVFPSCCHVGLDKKVLSSDYHVYAFLFFKDTFQCFLHVLGDRSAAPTNNLDRGKLSDNVSGEPAKLHRVALVHLSGVVKLCVASAGGVAADTAEVIHPLLARCLGSP